MVVFLWFSLSFLVAVHGNGIKNCYTGCRCEVESFGLFDSFSLTRVDCRGLGPGSIMPIPIPLDTTHLDLSSSALGPLSDTMLAGPGYTTLVSLDLSNNLLTKISSNALSKLRYMETLDLSHNNLESLPSNCFTGIPLTEVDLSHNSFQEFNLDVFGTKVSGEPISVDLSNNRLVSLTLTEGKMLHIQNLNLSANWLTSVPWLAGLPLRYLNLDGNLIEEIKEGPFTPLTDLVYLSISSPRTLHQIQPHSFKGLQSLQVLDLSNNLRLKSLSTSVFIGLDALQELHLSGSGVTSLPKNMLLHLPSVKRITLGKNFHCRRTQKQSQFHPQLSQVPHNEALTCKEKSDMMTDSYVTCALCAFTCKCIWFN